MTLRMVQDVSTAAFYVESPNGQSAPNTYPMPVGHCMFAEPWEYGKVRVWNGIPRIPASEMLAVQRYIVTAMRRYWRVRSKPHTWRDIYPGLSDRAANARNLARFLSDRGIKFRNGYRID